MPLPTFGGGYATPKGSRQLYPDQMFNLGGAAVTTLTAMNPGTTSSSGAFSVKTSGYLEKIIIKVTPQAATSLAQSGYITLQCTTFSPQNTLTIPFNGFGLATAPQAVGGNTLDTVIPPIGDGYLNLPVSTAVQIVGQVVYFYSPVTPNIVVLGLFSAN